MSSIFDEYLPLYQQLRELSEQYAEAERGIAAETAAEIAARKRRIERMEEQLDKIDEYRAKVEAYEKLAEAHVKSDVQDFVVPRELNFKRMRDWSLCITPDLEDDPYARRVLALARSNLMYLAQKQREFEQAIEALENAKTGPSAEELAEQKRIRGRLEDRCMQLVGGDEFTRFASRLKTRHDRCSDPALLQRLTDTPPEKDAAVGIGGYAQALPVLGAARGIVKSMLPEHFDESAGSILLPVELPLRGRSVVSVACAPGREKRLYRALQNYLLNLIGAYPVGENRIFLLDALHYNSTALGLLRPLADSGALEEIPRDAEALTDALRRIVSDFADTDEALGVLDTVDEYNDGAEAGKRIARTSLVLIGYPTAFPAEARELVQRILLNAERYGVSAVTVDNRAPSREERAHDAASALSGVLRVRMLPESTTISGDDGREQNFRWYELRQELNGRFVEEVKHRSAASGKKGNVYAERVPLDAAPAYTRGKKRISLPYGVDSRDEVQSAVFDNDNFAAFLMGASGSGKSTLLHTLITGILANYHPDDVELWLADFKMAEFAQYIDPMPPHVKYILLDESRELVYDLIDRLTDLMLERQRYFMQAEQRDLENVPERDHLPVIFVILDEFSLMSQAVEESEAYKLKLQNLLAKGRALGIKFIFSSQTFTTGVRGLTATAKGQIQMRIAMKNSREEKQQTLELSSAEVTDQVRGWLDALPPHFTLTKHYNADKEKNEVEKLQVLYFPGKGDASMAPQRELIRRIRQKLHPVDHYTPEDPDSYVDKHPVVVDGNNFDAFSAARCREAIALLHAGSDYNGDEVFCYAGTPRLMRSMREIAVTPESRQNLLVIGDSSERGCVCSVISSVMRCFALQNRRVEIWAYERDRIYRAMREGPWAEFPACSDMEQLCDRIRQLKKAIRENTAEQETLIVLLGFENVCADFEYILKPGETAASDSGAMASVRAGLLADGDKEDEQSAQRRALFRQLQQADQEEDAAEEDEPDGEEDIEKLFERMVQAEQKKLQAIHARAPENREVPGEKAATKTEPASEKQSEKEHGEESGLYNAREDFQFCLRQGSRRGIHFLLQLNSLTDLKQAGARLEWFRHRLAFSLPTDDSFELFRSRDAAGLPEHICLYSDTISRFSMRPYLHEGVGWDGWGLDAEGKVISPRSLMK